MEFCRLQYSSLYVSKMNGARFAGVESEKRSEVESMEPENTIQTSILPKDCRKQCLKQHIHCLLLSYTIIVNSY